MNLTPRERDKLMIAVAAQVARARLARGVKLNYPESVALITDFVLEGARDVKSVAELMSESGKILRRDQVMEGIPEMIHEMQVEATFPDNSKLISIHDPIREEGANGSRRDFRRRWRDRHEWRSSGHFIEGRKRGRPTNPG